MSDNILEVAQRYFDAWDRHDPEGIVAIFAEKGTYADPTTGGELAGAAIGEYARRLFTAFPDLSFKIVSVGIAGDSTVAAQWLMSGTNTGPFMGGPPTGGRVALPGADFITIAGDKVLSVRGYFDQKTLVEQLGLQAIVQPRAIGPVTFGRSVHMQGPRKTRPGAFSLTMINVRSRQEA